MKPYVSILVAGLVLAGCNKPVPQVVAPIAPVVVVAQAPKMTNPTDNPIIVVQPTKTSVQPVVKPTKEKTSPKVLPVTKPVKKSNGKSGDKSKNAKNKAFNQREAAAYRVAFVNKVVYVCFKRLYEVIGPPTSENIKRIDADREGFAGYCVQLGAVQRDDVKEFQGKF